MSELVGAEAWAVGAETEELVDMNDTGSEEYPSGSENGEEHYKPSRKPRWREKLPRPATLRPGQMYFSSHFHVKLTISQQKRLGASNSGTRNKCRKSRPLVIVEVSGERALAMFSTTRGGETWRGVTEDIARSFLPISPTRSEFERPVVNLADDERHVFVGSSLFFLETQNKISSKHLSDYIGSLTEEGLATLKAEHRRWVDGRGVVPSVSHWKEEGDEEEDKDGDGDEDEVAEVEGEEGAAGCYKNADGEGWTTVPPRKRPQSVRGRGWRDNRNKGNCHESLSCGYLIGGKRAQI
ncbi:unnamed protein product [Tuber aestivum]|uniref:Uncharacterized protein n=1 Tax=Tuber aestivum TaxID=59557 RepID=A0A292Q2P6_9PEZI|nr:unnamed protein product [Tuber aestivum]